MRNTNVDDVNSTPYVNAVNFEYPDERGS